MNNKSPHPSDSTWEALCILSLDGGGVRGLASLLILQEIMTRLNAERLKLSLPTQQPWEVFDMICGTSTGGLIAIMLGRLRMNIDEAIKAYVELAEDIFTETKWVWKEGTYKATNLERAIKIIVGRYGVRDTSSGMPLAISTEEKDKRDQDLGSNVRMLESRVNPVVRGKVFVCSITADNASSATRLRTYTPTANAIPDCMIWEAARATTAAPKFFKPMLIKENGLDVRYVDGALRCNNPTKELLDEAATHFPDRQVACVLSLGTGRRHKIMLPDTGIIPKYQLLAVVDMLKKITLDCEVVHQELAHRFHNRNTYFRFNVDQGLEEIGLAEWKSLNSLQTDTRTFLRTAPTTYEIDNAVKAIVQRNGGGNMSVEQVAGR